MPDQQITIGYVPAGRLAVLKAGPDYDDRDWDRTVNRLVAEGFIPLDPELDPQYSTESGTEYHIWYRPESVARAELFWEQVSA